MHNGKCHVVELSNEGLRIRRLYARQHLYVTFRDLLTLVPGQQEMQIE